MLRFAVNNLFARPLRSSLAMTGLAVAIAAMVGLFSIAGGIDELVSRTFSNFPGLLVQQRGAPLPLFSSLPRSWKPELEAIPGVRVVNEEIVARINVLESKTIISPPRFLVGLDLPNRVRLRQDIYRDSIVEGRFLQVEDAGQNVCIISREIADQFDKSVGDRFRVDSYDCEIVGIYRCGLLMLDTNVLMDLKTVRKLTRYDPESTSCFYLEAEPDADLRELKSRIEAQFTGRDIRGQGPPGLLTIFSGTGGATQENPVGSVLRWLDASLKGTEEVEKPPDDRPASVAVSTSARDPATSADEEMATQLSAIEVRSAEDWSARFVELRGDLDIFLSLLAVVGMVIAVVSTLNTMFMSVTERMVEFGILRANGWSRRNVAQLITLESGTLGLAGGLLGIVLGLIAIQVVNVVWADRVFLFASPLLLLGSLAMSMGLGICGGLYPAWVAATMSPMKAIRR